MIGLIAQANFDNLVLWVGIALLCVVLIGLPARILQQRHGYSPASLAMFFGPLFLAVAFGLADSTSTMLLAVGTFALTPFLMLWTFALSTSTPSKGAV